VRDEPIRTTRGRVILPSVAPVDDAFGESCRLGTPKLSAGMSGWLEGTWPSRKMPAETRTASRAALTGRTRFRDDAVAEQDDADAGWEADEPRNRRRSSSVQRA
jgi:hypothetical protein